ncbi:HEAT repeat domain-containing protein [Halocatena pleomorpha]|uniref:HEAT repeat domain-containing protein n=1 Tax=Halocatena pleomorpha TaxID=1785090 RepID=A0A3P3RBN3_9EURY|nr:hypothetical protein [Halocatena pleomorpha]RRJ30734.1 hypothetical protein EIK79_08865 [Halocatena pleomorpha]
MSDSDNLIEMIERDPGRFDEHVGAFRTILESDETDTRRTATRLIGDVAEVDPEIGTRHPGLLELAFGDPDSVVRGLAVGIVAAITKTTPEIGADFVPQLSAVLTDEELTGSSQMDGIRALGKIDRETSTSVSEADEALATLLRDTNGHVRETVAINLDDTVKAAPRAFPAMLKAFVSVLDDSEPEVRLHAAETLTIVAHEDVEAIEDIDMVLTGLKELRSDQVLPTERVEKMINITEVGAGYAEK